MQVRALSWNLFHGRDAPPNPELQRTAWRLSGKPLDDGRYLQLNRTLEREFVSLLARAEWSVCLLQEAPPAWAASLGRATGAQVDRSLTARNQLAPLTQLIARWRPDLLGAWEGGSNTTLVRPPWEIVPRSCRTLLLSPWRERGIWERRRMAFLRARPAGAGDDRQLCVANLHATNRSRALAERQLQRAAAAAVGWAAGTPLILGGDFNVRPRTSPALFAELERRHGLRAPTDPASVDHLLARGLEIVSPPRPWPAERRELERDTPAGPRRIRLSDHAPVEAVFGIR